MIVWLFCQPRNYLAYRNSIWLELELELELLHQFFKQMLNSEIEILAANRKRHLLELDLGFRKGRKHPISTGTAKVPFCTLPVLQPI